MKNLLLIFISWTVLFSCSSDDYPPLPDFPAPIVEDDSDLDGPDPIDSIPIYSKMTILQKKFHNPSVTERKMVYTFDESGKVIKSNTIDHVIGKEWSDEFEYDEAGRITEVKRNGELLYYIKWIGNEAHKYNKIDKKVGKARYVRSFLKEYTLWYAYGDSVTAVCIYDENRNIKYAKRKGSTSKTTYKDYDLDVLNPFYLLKSLEPADLMGSGVQRESFKNIYNQSHSPGYMGDDYYQPENTVHRYFEYDEQGRVFSMTNDVIPYLLWEFFYEE